MQSYPHICLVIKPLSLPQLTVKELPTTYHSILTVMTHLDLPDIVIS